MTTLLPLAIKKPALLIEFARQLDGVVVRRYTNLDIDYRDPEGASPEYSALPQLELTLPPLSGSLDVDPAQLELPVDSSDAFLASLTSPEVSPFHTMRVTEISFGSLVVEGFARQLLFFGRVTKAIKNARGRPNIVRIEAISEKGRFDVPMGISANHTCAWTFGGRGCNAPLDDLSNWKTFTVSSISGTKLILSAPLPAPLEKWRRGYVERGGLRLTVREVSSSDPSITLTRRPPADWIGLFNGNFNNRTNGVLLAGCDKRLVTCRTVHNRESQFGGFGYAMPAYNPNFELS